MPHTQFTRAQLAEYLHITEADVQRIIRNHEIEFVERGERILFEKKDVDVWASQRILVLPKNDLGKFHASSEAAAALPTDGTQILRQLLTPDRIQLEMPAKTRSGVMRAMVDLSEKTNLVYDPPALLESIIEREGLCSTALAGGFALLHPRHHEPYTFEDSFIVLGRTQRPVYFGSPDGATTDVFFLLGCDSDRQHLHVLARLCMICQQTAFLLNLREAEDAQAVWQALAEAEREVMG